MDIETFTRKVNTEHGYAVGFITEEYSFILESYPTIEKLEVGLRKWNSYALQENKPLPYPLRLSEEGPEVMKELLH